MIRLIVAGAGLALAAAAPVTAQGATTVVQFGDRTAAEQAATAYLPGGAVQPGAAVDGALAPAVEREVLFNAPVDVSLVGVSAANRLVLRNPRGQTVEVRIRCFWADAAGAVRSWREFNCFRAGVAAGAGAAGRARHAKQTEHRGSAAPPDPLPATKGIAP